MTWVVGPARIATSQRMRIASTWRQTRHAHANWHAAGHAGNWTDGGIRAHRGPTGSHASQMRSAAPLSHWRGGRRLLHGVLVAVEVQKRGLQLLLQVRIARDDDVARVPRAQQDLLVLSNVELVQGMHHVPKVDHRLHVLIHLMKQKVTEQLQCVPVKHGAC
eukprot:scaffold630_cov218-Pinguiococcus_pyrenoidosus.AAC.6